MDFKKLFRKDDKAVSPVIGVILMVAITVILAAAIGSSVFSQGSTKSAPQVSLDIKADGTYNTSSSALTLKFEHLGGDVISLDNESTKIMMSVSSINSGDSQQVTAVTSPTGGSLTLSVGDIKKFTFDDTTPTAIEVVSGNKINIKFIDINSGQIFYDKNLVI